LVQLPRVVELKGRAGPLDLHVNEGCSSIKPMLLPPCRTQISAGAFVGVERDIDMLSPLRRR
jgi:hypothetical protein